MSDLMSERNRIAILWIAWLSAGPLSVCQRSNGPAVFRGKRGGGGKVSWRPAAAARDDSCVAAGAAARAPGAEDGGQAGPFLLPSSRRPFSDRLCDAHLEQANAHRRQIELLRAAPYRLDQVSQVEWEPRLCQKP